MSGRDGGSPLNEQSKYSSTDVWLARKHRLGGLLRCTLLALVCGRRAVSPALALGRADVQRLRG